MEVNLSNRMDQHQGKRKGGRPTLAEVAARSAPQTPVIASIPNPNPTLPPIKGFTCLCCGRGMNPRIYQTVGAVRYIACELCAGRMKMTYSDDASRAVSIQRI